MNNLFIGKLAETAGVNIQTIRYYERIGLIPQPQRKESGYRQYDKKDVQKIKFIKRAKELGFTLREIQDLLTLRVDPDSTCEDIRERAEKKITDIEEKISELKRIKKALDKLTTACVGRGPTGDCPILEALESET